MEDLNEKHVDLEYHADTGSTTTATTTATMTTTTKIAEQQTSAVQQKEREKEKEEDRGSVGSDQSGLQLRSANLDQHGDFTGYRHYKTVIPNFGGNLPSFTPIPTQIRLRHSQMALLLTLGPVSYLVLSLLQNFQVLPRDNDYLDIGIVLGFFVFSLLIIQLQLRMTIQNYQRQQLVFNQLKFHALSILPILTIMFPYLMIKYCLWLKQFSLTHNATVTLWLHVTLMLVLQEIYEYFLASIGRPFLFARLSFIVQMAACFPFYLLLNQIDWSMSFIVSSVILSLHSALHTSNVYLFLFRKIKTWITKTIQLEDEWLRALEQEHRLRIYMQAALADVWSFVTLWSVWLSFSSFASEESQILLIKALQPKIMENEFLAHDVFDWRKLVLIVCCRAAAWTLAEILNRKHIDILQNRAHIRNYLKEIEREDVFLADDLRACLLADYPDLILSLEEDTTISHNNFSLIRFGLMEYYGKFMGRYAVAINLVLLFVALNPVVNGLVLRDVSYAFFISPR